MRLLLAVLSISEIQDLADQIHTLSWSRKFGRGFKWRVCSSAA